MSMIDDDHEDLHEDGARHEDTRGLDDGYRPGVQWVSPAKARRAQARRALLAARIEEPSPGRAGKHITDHEDPLEE